MIDLGLYQSDSIQTTQHQKTIYNVQELFSQNNLLRVRNTHKP